MPRRLKNEPSRLTLLQRGQSSLIAYLLHKLCRSAPEPRRPNGSVPDPDGPTAGARPKGKRDSLVASRRRSLMPMRPCVMRICVTPTRTPRCPLTGPAPPARPNSLRPRSRRDRRASNTSVARAAKTKTDAITWNTPCATSATSGNAGPDASAGASANRRRRRRHRYAPWTTHCNDPPPTRPTPCHSTPLPRHGPTAPPLALATPSRRRCLAMCRPKARAPPRLAARALPPERSRPGPTQVPGLLAKALAMDHARSHPPLRFQAIVTPQALSSRNEVSKSPFVLMSFSAVLCV